jgi:hypothetical protein
LKKPKMVKTGLDSQIAELAGKADHKTLRVWACDCAERVLSYFEKIIQKTSAPGWLLKQAEHGHVRACSSWPMRARLRSPLTRPLAKREETTPLDLLPVLQARR